MSGVGDRSRGAQEGWDGTLRMSSVRGAGTPLLEGGRGEQSYGDGEAAARRSHNNRAPDRSVARTARRGRQRVLHMHPAHAVTGMPFAENNIFTHTCVGRRIVAWTARMG